MPDPMTPATPAETGGNFLDDLHAEVVRRGESAVATAAGISLARVHKFVLTPMEIRISTLSAISRAVGMPIACLHLVDRRTDVCMTCDQPRSAHYPMLPEER